MQRPIMACSLRSTQASLQNFLQAEDQDDRTPSWFMGAGLDSGVTTMYVLGSATRRREKAVKNVQVVNFWGIGLSKYHRTVVL